MGLLVVSCRRAAPGSALGGVVLPAVSGCANVGCHFVRGRRALLCGVNPEFPPGPTSSRSGRCLARVRRTARSRWPRRRPASCRRRRRRHLGRGGDHPKDHGALPHEIRREVCLGQTVIKLTSPKKNVILLGRISTEFLGVISYCISDIYHINYTSLVK